jgi:hypothetical protein
MLKMSRLSMEYMTVKEAAKKWKISQRRVNTCGIQEVLFDNPVFTFVATTLLKVKDHFEEATALFFSSNINDLECMLEKTSDYIRLNGTCVFRNSNEGRNLNWIIYMKL